MIILDVPASSEAEIRSALDAKSDPDSSAQTVEQRGGPPSPVTPQRELHEAATAADRAAGLAAGAILVCLYHEVVRGLGVNVWLSFVYSEDNWSDEPSRGVYRSLLAAGGRRRPMVFPSKRRMWDLAVDFGAVEE